MGLPGRRARHARKAPNLSPENGGPAMRRSIGWVVRGMLSLGVLSFAGCGGNDVTAPGNTSGTGMSAKIDGASWAAAAQTAGAYGGPNGSCTIAGPQVISGAS